MQRLVTGTDEDGRSCVVSRETQEPADGGPGVSVLDTMVDITQTPPPSRPAGSGDFVDLEVAPGQLRWMVIRWEADAEFAMHHTDSIDLDTVLAGSMQLTLDDGTHQLEPGDCVVVNGVDHAWRAGPEGCTMSIAIYGTPAP